MSSGNATRRAAKKQQQRLVELADWWWKLTPAQRAIKRDEFMRRVQTDPVFLSQVRKLMHEEQP